MLREMKISGLLSLILLLSINYATAAKVYSFEPAIVGGNDAVITQHPHQVSVRLLNSFVCGGSILSESWVLTAAHCLRTYLNPALHSVQYGLTVIGGTENVIKASATMVHEWYDSDTANYDVGLMRLESPIPLGLNARPISIARSTPPTGTPAIITGWGWIEDGGPTTKTLQQAEVEIYDHVKCQERFAAVRTVTPAMLCAGLEEGGKDTCRGDSGGPVVDNNGIQIGIISWGVGCARPGTPGVSCNVALVSDWILNHMKYAN